MAKSNPDMSFAWIEALAQDVPHFLSRLKEPGHPGFFHYSLSGDLIPPHKHWGLGNTVFAIKTYATLQQLNTLPTPEIQNMQKFIISFQHANGSIYDPEIKKRGFLYDKVKSLLRKDLNNFFHKQTVIAETRQSLTALRLLGSTAAPPEKLLASNKQDVDRYLSRLDWKHPWGAGSHFSHLISFLSHSSLEDKEELISHAIEWVNKIQNPNDGAWYRGHPGIQQKINGAMKVFTGLRVAGQIRINYAEKLVDLCLAASQDKHACDNFNVIYALHNASTNAPGYRAKDIRSFAANRLNNYKHYYWPEHGGFSSLIGRANNRYYGAHITKGLPEPDIHGTSMFLWGISILSQYVNIKSQFKTLLP